MSFKKLDIDLLNMLEEEGITTALPFQDVIIPKIKSGADHIFIGPKGTGKTTALIISVIQKLNQSESSNSPRVIIMVKDKKTAQEMEQIFKDLTIMMDLDIFSVFESQQIYNQKDTIYYGVDVVIATPGRLYELYKESGIPLNELKMFVIENGEALINNKHMLDLERITESIGKCQFLLLADEYLPRMDEVRETFMSKANLVEKEG